MSLFASIVAQATPPTTTPAFQLPQGIHVNMNTPATPYAVDGLSIALGFGFIACMYFFFGGLMTVIATVGNKKKKDDAPGPAGGGIKMGASVIGMAVITTFVAFLQGWVHVFGI